MKTGQDIRERLGIVVVAQVRAPAVWECTCGWGLEVTLASFLGAVCLNFQDKVLLRDPGPLNSSKLTSQSTPGISLALHPRCWGPVLWVLENELRLSDLHGRQALYRVAVLAPLPTTLNSPVHT